MSSNLSPVTVAERVFGSIERVAEITGNRPKSGYSWRWPSGTSDAGDFRSMRHVRAIHAYALARHIPLTLDHLIYGATEAEVEAILSNSPAAPARIEAAE